MISVFYNLFIVLVGWRRVRSGLHITLGEGDDSLVVCTHTARHCSFEWDWECYKGASKGTRDILETEDWLNEISVAEMSFLCRLTGWTIPFFTAAPGWRAPERETMSGGATLWINMFLIYILGYILKSYSESEFLWLKILYYFISFHITHGHLKQSCCAQMTPNSSLWLLINITKRKIQLQCSEVQLLDDKFSKLRFILTLNRLDSFVQHKGTCVTRKATQVWRNLQVQVIKFPIPVGLTNHGPSRGNRLVNPGHYWPCGDFK